MIKLAKPFIPQLGTSSKFQEGSVSINFSESGSDNCSDQCRLKRGPCYAIKTEKRYPAVKQNGLKRRALGPVQICNYARLQIRQIRDAWVRFSVLGSLPMVAEAKRTKGFKKAFQDLVIEIESSGSRIHLPLESKQKAAHYQAWIDEVSTKTIARESCQTENRLKTAKNHRSFVVGKKGEPMIDRIDQCRAMASEIRDNGQTAIVCPAIKPRNYSGSKRKCGDCKACASRSVDVVLYALH